MPATAEKSKPAASAGSTESRTMQVSPGPTVKRRLRTPKRKESDSLDSLAETTSSWGDLEVLKGRTASAMDRVEYLASTANLFTDFRATEAKDLSLSLRHTLKTGGRQNLNLSDRISKSKSAASLVLSGQKEKLLGQGTIVKRADALTKFIVNNEVQKGGKPCGEAAKSSAKGTTFRMMRPYPLYDELYEHEERFPGQVRESPMLSVSIRMPYTLTEKARLHGTPKEKTKRRGRRSSEEESEEENDEG